MTRKLHYKHIVSAASAHTGRPGDIWFDESTTVLRAYSGDPGGKNISGGAIGDTGQTPNGSDHPFQDYNA